MVERTRLKQRLDRERKARLKAEAIRAKPTRELVQRQEELSLLLTITAAANEATAIEDVLQTVIDRICARTGWPIGHGYLLAADGSGELASTAIWHLANPERFEVFRKVTERTRLGPGVGLPGRVLASGKPAWVLDMTQEEDGPQAKQAKASGLTAAFAFPVVSGTNVVAVLAFFADTAGEPDGHLVALMTRIGAQLGRVIERQQGREALLRSELYFRHLTDNALEFITVLNRDGTIRYESPYVELTLGYEPEDYLGKSAFDFVHQDDLAGVLAAFADCLQTPGNTPTLTFRFRHKDGSWRVLEGMGNNLLDDRVVAGVIFNARDMTERTQAEAALRESELRFRSLVQSSPNAIISADRKGSIVSWNRGAQDTFGYKEEEVLGKPMALLMPERYRDAHQRGLERFGATGESRVIGRTIELHGLRKDGSEFPLDLSLATWKTAEGIFYSGIIRDITERKAFEEHLAHQAFHDSLTNLPNRPLFMNRLEQALARMHRGHKPLAVLFLDLDHLKVVNDSLGHRVGDQLLTSVGERLQACLRPEDTVARFGGDEFVILLEEITDLIDAIRVAERIAERLQGPLTLEGYEVVTTASIGIVLSSSDYNRPDDLLRAADLAMYQAKNRGRARYEIFDPSLNERARQRLELGTDLRQAIERGEFRVYYQPVLALETGRISEVEALVRWEHPRRGLSLPGEFIPLAEETGLIVPIGQWVMEEACRQARVWQTRYPSDPPLVMCVNLSARQFQQPTLVEDVSRVLFQTGLDPASLMLEITESMVMEDEQSTLATLRKLKDSGVQLAIDDFGVGYSSLRYLKHFPVDNLKIDRVFIDRLGQDPVDEAIVRAVISVAKTLGLTVTAEGVETADQLAHVKALKCDRAQGFYFSRPLSSAAISELLAVDPRW